MLRQNFMYRNVLNTAKLLLLADVGEYSFASAAIQFQGYEFHKIWTPLVPDLISFWPMGEPKRGKWANDYDVVQPQV